MAVSSGSLILFDTEMMFKECFWLHAASIPDYTDFKIPD